MSRTLPRALAVLAALSLLAMGCGSSNDNKSSPKKGGGGAAPASDLPKSCKNEQGVTDDSIKLTVISDLSGPIATAGGIGHAKAFKAHFDAINAAGGIDGRKIDVDVRDGKYDPQVAAQQYEQARLDTAMVPDILGSSMIEAVAPDMEEDCLITFQGATNGQLAQKYTSVFSPSTSAGHDIVSGVAYALEQDPKAKFALAYQSDAYGEALKAAADWAAKESGFQYAATVSFGPRDDDVTAQTQALLKADPDYVVYGGLPTQLAGLSAGVHAAGNDMKFLVPTGAWTAALLKSPAKAAIEANVVIVTPYAAWDSDAPGAVRMRDELKEFAPDLQPGVALQTAYVAAFVTGKVLEEASQADDLSLGGLYRAAASLKFDADGLVPPGEFGSLKDQPRIPSVETAIFRPDASKTGGVTQVSDGFVNFDLSARYVEPN